MEKVSRKHSEEEKKVLDSSEARFRQRSFVKRLSSSDNEAEERTLKIKMGSRTPKSVDDSGIGSSCRKDVVEGIEPQLTPSRRSLPRFVVRKMNVGEPGEEPTRHYYNYHYYGYATNAWARLCYLVLAVMAVSLLLAVFTVLASRYSLLMNARRQRVDSVDSFDPGLGIQSAVIHPMRFKRERDPKTGSFRRFQNDPFRKDPFRKSEEDTDFSHNDDKRLD